MLCMTLIFIFKGGKMESILMFLIPKAECEYLNNNSTIRQALEKMEYHRYTAIPVLDNDGKYVNTLTEGDLLWTIKKKYFLNFKEAEDSYIKDITPNREVLAVDCNASLRDVIEKLLNSNFVPVVDDRGVFIGIITRKRILSYYFKK